MHRIQSRVFEKIQKCEKIILSVIEYDVKCCEIDGPNVDMWNVKWHGLEGLEVEGPNVPHYHMWLNHSAKQQIKM